MENEDSKALLHLWLRASVGRGADKQQRESHFFGVFQGEQEFIRLMAEGKKHSKPNAKAWK